MSATAFVKPMLATLWAMLKSGANGAPVPSMQEVGHWVTGENFSDVAAKVGEALRDAFPVKTDNPPPTVGDGTGPAPSLSLVPADSLSSNSGG